MDDRRQQQQPESDAADARLTLGHWYRNYAVQISEGRYSRDGWRPEPERERDHVLKRSTSGQRVDGRHIVTQPDKRLPGPAPKYSEADLPEMRNLYRRQRVERVPGGQGLRVVAVCTGAWCGGRERMFTTIDWAEGQPKLRGCSKCVGALRKQERAAHREALRHAGRPLHNMRGQMS